MRFLSLADPDLGVIRYSIKPLDFNGKAEFNVYLDGDVKNEDTNYGEKFWEDVSSESADGEGIITSRTLKTGFYVSTGMKYQIRKNGKTLKTASEVTSQPGFVAGRVEAVLNQDDELVLYKYVSVQSSLNHSGKDLPGIVKRPSDLCFQNWI